MGLGFGVWGLGFGAWGLGLGVWGLGFGLLVFFGGVGGGGVVQNLFWFALAAVCSIASLGTEMPEPPKSLKKAPSGQQGPGLRVWG